MTRGPFDRGWTGIRAGLRLGAFGVANLALALVFFLGLPLTRGRLDRRKRWRDRIFAAWARACLRCVGVRLRVRGTPPRGPTFLVANHLVYFDIWVIAAATPAVFVAESGIARWPFFGFMARQLSIVFVDRERKRALPEVNRRIEEALSRGAVLAMFPEATTGDGRTLLPFRSSLLEPAARGGHAVRWATIEYRTSPPDPPAEDAVVWKRGVPLLRHARRVVLLDRVDATLTFGEDAVAGGDRKELAAELERRVGAALHSA